MVKLVNTPDLKSGNSVSFEGSSPSIPIVWVHCFSYYKLSFFILERKSYLLFNTFLTIL